MMVATATACPSCNNPCFNNGPCPSWTTCYVSRTGAKCLCDFPFQEVTKARPYNCPCPTGQKKVPSTTTTEVTVCKDAPVAGLNGTSCSTTYSYASASAQGACFATAMCRTDYNLIVGSGACKSKGITIAGTYYEDCYTAELDLNANAFKCVLKTAAQLNIDEGTYAKAIADGSISDGCVTSDLTAEAQCDRTTCVTFNANTGRKMI